MNITIPQALCALSFVGIASAVATYWFDHRRYWRDMALVVHQMEEKRKIEVGLVKTQAFAQGKTNGALGAIRLTRARLEEEYQTGWKAHEAAMGLNMDLAHRTESQN